MSDNLTRSAVQATLHCLTGCAIGEILGNVIGASLGWSTMSTEMLAIPLAFVFGYALTMRSLLKQGLGVKQAGKLALASDTFSILTMEIVDTFVIFMIPGAISSGPSSSLFWISMIVALSVAFVFAVPVNRWLLARGRGHALVHKYHS